METTSKTKGLAPFASVEDLSDEQDSPGHEKNRLALPGIKEDTGVKSPRKGSITITPRIDISRASSSSHHDDSSPERDLFAGPGAAPGGFKLGLGFSEEMALELRSSTEELDFQDPADTEIKMKRKKLHQQQAVIKCEPDIQSDKDMKDIKERKDSTCSDIGLLSISGRTSRLSSIGSAASGGSGASHMSGVSHLSGASHLSGVSGVSGASHLSAVSHLSQLSKASRCSSPHRMLLETSFCGPKPIPTVSLEAEYPPDECVEAALLARKSDPTGAVLPLEGSKPIVSENRRLSSSALTLTVKKPSRAENKSKYSTDSISRTHSGKTTSSSKTKRHVSAQKLKLNEFEQIIPLHGEDDIVVDTETTEIKTEKIIPPENGIYIPLKGPDIIYTMPSKHDYSSTDKQVKLKIPKTKMKKDEELVTFISLHADESERKPLPMESKSDETCLLTKRDLKLLNSNQLDGQVNVIIQSDVVRPDELTMDPNYVRKHSAGSCRSPDFEGAKAKPSTLDLTEAGPSKPSQSLTQLPRDESRTPSPSTSLYRGSLFRRSSESSSSSKSRVSGSSETKSKKESRHKSSFTNLFKKGGKEKSSTRKKSEGSDKSFTSGIETSHEDSNHIRTQSRKHDVDSIIIPLHSPDSVVEPVLLAADMDFESIVDVHLVKTPSKSLSLKSQDLTPPSVIEVITSYDVHVEPVDYTETNAATDVSTEEKPADTVKEEIEREAEVHPVEVKLKAEVHPVEVNLKAEVDVQSKLEVDVKQKSEPIVNKTNTELTDLLGSDKKCGSDERRSSGSEPDSDVVPIPNGEDDDHERKGLVHQTESVEDELPYVPTTLPQERSVAHPIVPIKQRVSEVKTCPIERPRSTTPINPATLDDYVSNPQEDVAPPKDKMQIILPRTASVCKEGRSKSPANVKSWTHFTEQGLQSPRELRRNASPSPPSVTPPPLPPRVTANWVSFEDLPERRRTPKRIITLPPQQPTANNIVYSYVNPEECSCECHETQGRVSAHRAGQCNTSDKHRT